MKIDTALSDRELREALEKEGVRIFSVAQYYAGETEKKEHIFVVNYSSLQEENMEKVIRCMENVLEGSQKGRHTDCADRENLKDIKA